MLQITVPARDDLWDEANEEFITCKEQTLRLEHSLVSISKWEAKWHKAFLGKQKKTEDELRDYVRCMTLTQNVDPLVYKCLTEQNMSDIQAYISDPMTSAKFSKYYGREGKDTPMNELIYYWMICFNIPVEFEKWHLNHLMALIRVCEIKNSKGTVRGKDSMARMAEINEDRKKALHSKG